MQVSTKNSILFCEYQTTVEMVNTGRARNVFAQEYLHEICYLTAKANLVIKMVHKPGMDNRISDCLSRWYLGQNYVEQFMKETEGMRVKEIRFKQEHFHFFQQLVKHIVILC